MGSDKSAGKIFWEIFSVSIHQISQVALYTNPPQKTNKHDQGDVLLCYRNVYRHYYANKLAEAHPVLPLYRK